MRAESITHYDRKREGDEYRNLIRTIVGREYAAGGRSRRAHGGGLRFRESGLGVLLVYLINAVGRKITEFYRLFAQQTSVGKSRKRVDHPWQPIRKISASTRIVLAPYPMEPSIAVHSVQRSRAYRISTVNAGMQSARAIRHNRRELAGAVNTNRLVGARRNDFYVLPFCK